MRLFAISTFVVGSALTCSALAQVSATLMDSAFSLRARNDHKTDGTLSKNQVQYNIDLKLQLQLGKDGQWRVVTRTKTGAAFESGFNDAGIGNNTQFVDDIHMRQLYVQYESKGNTASAGFLPVIPTSNVKGAFSIDEDGWIDGARLETTKLGKWAKRVSVSVGRIDDLSNPSAFDRGIDSPNVIMVHIQGNLSERVSYVVEGTQFNPALAPSEQYFRTMVDIATKDTLGFIDKIVIEPLIQNTSHPLQGFAAGANKAIGSSWTATAQYSFKGQTLSSQEKLYAPREDFYRQGHQLNFLATKKFKAKHPVEWSFGMGKTVNDVGLINTKGLRAETRLKIKF